MVKENFQNRSKAKDIVKELIVKKWFIMGSFSMIIFIIVYLNEKLGIHNPLLIILSYMLLPGYFLVDLFRNTPHIYILIFPFTDIIGFIVNALLWFIIGAIIGKIVNKIYLAIIIWAMLNTIIFIIIIFIGSQLFKYNNNF